MAFASLTIDLNARLANIERDLGRAAHIAETQSKKIEASFARAGAVMVGIGGALAGAGLVNFLSQTIDAADNMRDLAIATGTSVEALASYQLAAQQSGTSIEDVSAGMGKLSLFMAKNAEEAQKLGLTASDPAQAFAQLADVLARVEDPAQRNALAAQVLGKSYRELMPLLSQGGDEFRGQAAAAAPYAAKMGALAEQADKFKDALAGLKQTGSTFGITVAGPIVTALNDILPAMQEAAKESGLLKAAWVGLGGAASVAFNGTEMQQASERLTELEGDIERFTTTLAQNRFTGGETGKGWLDAIIPDLAMNQDTRDRMTKQLQAMQDEAQKLRDKIAGGGKKKDAAKPIDVSDIIDPKFSDQLAKALNTTALDKFTAKFSDTRAKLQAEYAALKQTFGETASGPVTGYDIQEKNIGKAREALAGNDAAGAQAALESGKSRLKELSASGAPSFELNYLADQMKALELQAVDLSEKTATSARDAIVKSMGDINQQIAQVKNPELKINTDLLKQSIDAAVESARQQLAANPLVVPVIAAPKIGSNGGLSVSLTDAALKVGGR